jgi:hypothetical protein
LDYQGSPVSVPDQGLDPLDEHGKPQQAKPPLTPGRARDLAQQYHCKAVLQHETSPTGDVSAAKLDDWLRVTLRQELSPELVEAAFDQVMDLVFAM